MIKKRHRFAQGKKVGLDLGPSSIAVYSQESAFLCPLFKKPEDAKTIKHIYRALDRSRRINNPSNFNEKGIPLKGKKWKCSRRYQRLRAKLQEKKRILASHRLTQHGFLANQILCLGTNVKTERLSYKELQKKFGKSVGRHAPGLLLQILRRKAENAGGNVDEFSPYHAKLSQVCHRCGKTEKKPLSQRWHSCLCGAGPVQRDLYSAFLAYHVEGETLNRSQAEEAWVSAGPLLEQALLRCNEAAKGELRLACFGLSQRQSCSSVEDGSAVSEVIDAKKSNFEELTRLAIRTP